MRSPLRQTRTDGPAYCGKRLRQRRRNQSHGRPFSFLWLSEGKGLAWKGEDGYLEEDIVALLDEVMEEEDPGVKRSKLVRLVELAEREESRETEKIELEDRRKLGIATLGALKQHPRISAFRRFIEGWYLSYFTPDRRPAACRWQAPRTVSMFTVTTSATSCNSWSANIHGVSRQFSRGLQERSRAMDRIDTERTNDGRLLLRFNDKGFQDPFYAQQVSDWTLKVFAYLLLLEDPDPPPFLCIEEPENGLYHKLLETLADEFRQHSSERRGSQIFVTTHQPYFVDALEPREVWILEKGKDGFSTIRRASDEPIVNNMVEEGLPLGGLWYSDYFDAR